MTSSCQERLLHVLSIVLSGRPFSHAGSALSGSAGELNLIDEAWRLCDTCVNVCCIFNLLLVTGDGPWRRKVAGAYCKLLFD